MTIGSDADSSSRSMPFPPGSVLAGKYKVERLIGEGGMGWVVQATHLQLDQWVAIKFMHEETARQSPEAVARFLREARAAARIQSEHVARVSDFGTLESGAAYLVMEYLEGQDLDALLRVRGCLPVEEAIGYALQACEGLAEAHAAGIIHRDLKPANLFLARKSDGSVRVKLLDFGISKVAPSAGRTSDGAKTGTQNLMGSPLYMAPEQMRSSKHVDRRADIWSMGIILYEMLSGRSPFTGDTLPEVCARILADPPLSLRDGQSTVPAELESIVFRCLEKDANARFPDVASLARALAPFGPPELRLIADRLSRLLRAGAPGGPESSPGVSAPAPAAASSLIATHSSFGTAAPSIRVRRSPTTAIGISVALGVGALAASAMVATRGRRADAPSVAAATVFQAAPLPAVAASTLAPPPSSAPVVTAEPSATPPSTAAVASTGARTAASPPAATTLLHPAAAATNPRPAISKPKGSSTVAKPSATTGFGGRD